MKAAFLIIATNKYTEFLEPLQQSIVKNVKLPDCHIDTICFTNKSTSPRVIPTTKAFHTDHLPWPLITLLRYHTFNRYSEELSKYDYLYYIDADMQVVGEVGTEILGDLVVTQHPGFYNKNLNQCPFELRQGSKAVPTQMPKGYYIGAFQGGRAENFLVMSDHIAKQTDMDLYRNFIPVWHDESFMNAYMASQNPVVLNPGYCYPESWNIPFEKKIVARDKDQLKMRIG